MAKNPRRQQAAPTKKHLARLERERRQTRYIVIASSIVIVLVVGVLIYGILEQKVLRGYRTVANVNGEKISVDEFRAYTKYFRSRMIQNAQRSYQIANLFGNDPNTASSFISQLQGISGELDTFRAGQSALDEMVDNLLVRQEAKRQGITVSTDEVEKGMQEAMGYFANGTPTPTLTPESMATSTLSPLQLTLIPPTATLAPTAVPTATVTLTATQEAIASATPVISPTLAVSEPITPTATQAPTATPTPYTFEAYQNEYATVVADYKTNFEIPEATLRYVIESDIFRRKISEQVISEVSCTDEQVWALHILVADEQLARDIRQKLDKGEDWGQLAATYSTDTSNKDQGGDLGWFSKGRMVPEFEQAAFALKVGETSQPVQTQFGWHIIRALGHENRQISPSECTQLKQTKFSEWLKAQRDSSEVTINDFWQEIVPILPTLPAEIQQFLAQYQQSQQPPITAVPQP